jgi:prepilin-type N-terminal cleavage/methylation domain-containing protein
MRLKAFTLVEMMAGLAIAALVVSLGFYGVQLLQKQYLIFEKATDEALDYRRLEALLWHDFTAASWVLLENDSMIRCELGGVAVQYVVSPNHLTRAMLSASATVDTFPVHFAIEGARLDGKQIVKGLMDQCIFNIGPFGENQSLAVSKLYSAAERINFQKQHEH